MSSLRGEETGWQIREKENCHSKAKTSGNSRMTVRRLHEDLWRDLVLFIGVAVDVLGSEFLLSQKEYLSF